MRLSEVLSLNWDQNRVKYVTHREKKILVEEKSCTDILVYEKKMAVCETES